MHFITSSKQFTVPILKSAGRLIDSRCGISCSSCLTGSFKLPPNYDNVAFPERRRLKMIDKVPPIDPGIRPPKMMRDLHQMRGPELIQNKLLYGNFGLQAVTGGRISHKDTEAVRQIIVKQMDERYMFAVWRFNHLWQAVSRKGQGRRMGGGKGPIDHYVFPFRAERVVLEMGGRCELVEVYDVLKAIQKKLGFRTRIITHDSVRKREEKEKWVEENNMNPFTFKFCVQNNVLGCSKYLNRYDYMWFGKYL
ncbi:39S ribosomal protein L16, mitochondrial-like [Biomphalaria glabrata]|uniref:Large ribosomal subunit protein uL16m n=1 Tax=Biomphalaria glabrata TaxID=6526 RepID=A0A9W2YJV3_BIOGL|nr:39S ribosomal protein L16, mitochondrial-like [Biomphalaria glabrata]KAI8753666.1 39S ribosomal protein L16; mitochondrial [Biomphalaria glabrata]